MDRAARKEDKPATNRRNSGLRRGEVSGSAGGRGILFLSRKAKHLQLANPKPSITTTSRIEEKGGYS